MRGDRWLNPPEKWRDCVEDAVSYAEQIIGEEPQIVQPDKRLSTMARAILVLSKKVEQ